MKPNFVIFLSDEETYAPKYESSQLKKWREKNLPIETFFKNNGITFENHRINNTGCQPSRADLQTGVSYRKHGVKLTEGLSQNHENVTFVDPEKTPTLGNYLSDDGYNCYYKGKQHIKKTYDKYASLLSHGYKDWCPPEGHGLNLSESTAYFRDEGYVQEVLDLIPTLKEPYCLFISLLNPHDIVYWSVFGTKNKLFPFNIPMFKFDIDETVPDCSEWPTDHENLSTKPNVQTSYHDIYSSLLTFPYMHDILHEDKNKIRRFYYSLIKNVQQNFSTIFNALQNHQSYINTYFFYTSDHGELNGTHGNLFQKWYNFYEETIHVPLQIFHPIKKLNPVPNNILTCHYDIAPTILSLAKVQIPKLDGKNLAPYILNEKSWDILQYRRIEFNTLDDITNGTNGYSVLSQSIPFLYHFGFGKYEGVKGARHIHAQIKSTGDKIYKYAIYVNPDDGNDIEEEMYELTEDPYEEINLCHSSNFKQLKRKYFKRFCYTRSKL